MHKVMGGLCVAIFGLALVKQGIEVAKKEKEGQENNPLNVAGMKKILDKHNNNTDTINAPVMSAVIINKTGSAIGTTTYPADTRQFSIQLRNKVWEMANKQREFVAKAQNRPELLKRDIMPHHVFVIANEPLAKMFAQGGEMWRPEQGEYHRKSIHHTLIGEAYNTYPLKDNGVGFSPMSIMVFQASSNLGADKIIVGYYDENLGGYDWPGEHPKAALNREYGTKDYYGVLTVYTQPQRFIMADSK